MSSAPRRRLVDDRSIQEVTVDARASGTVAMVTADDVEVVVCRIDNARADLSLVDALARLQLAARRRGGSLRVHDASAELIQLLDLVGLSELVSGRPALT
jgi:ABC-type transporter Mla MlaB component